MYPGLFGEDSLITLGQARSGDITVWFTAWWVWLIKAFSLNTHAIPALTLAGVLMALWLRYTGPDTTLSFSIMIDILLMVVIGGMRSFLGPAFGALFFILFRELFSIWTADWLLWFGLIFVLITAPVWNTFLNTLRLSYTGYNAASAYQIQPSLLLGAFDEAFYRPLMPHHWAFNPSANVLLLLGVQTG